jgi:hypothetical protein
MTIALTADVLLDLCSRSQNETSTRFCSLNPVFPEVE